MAGAFVEALRFGLPCRGGGFFFAAVQVLLDCYDEVSPIGCFVGERVWYLYLKILFGEVGDIVVGACPAVNLPAYLGGGSVRCFPFSAGGSIRATLGAASFYRVTRGAGNAGLVFRSSSCVTTTAELFFLFFRCAVDGRCSFIVPDSSCRCCKAMADASLPMRGVATQRGRRIIVNSGGRRCFVKSSEKLVVLGETKDSVVIFFSSRVFLAKVAEDQGSSRTELATGCMGTTIMDDHQGLVHLWNESGIQIMVVLSFGMQVFLLVFAGTRRRRSSAFLRLSLWLVYLLADSTAIYALGHLSVASGKHQLVPFWAPFLLLHLGGPDNITAYSLEDNQLWKRHLQILIVQVLAAAYVTYKSMASSSGTLLLFLASISMFVVGLAKYGERTWALKCSCISSIRSSLSFHQIQHPCELLVAHDMSDEEILLVAHRYLHICKAAFTDFPCSLIVHGFNGAIPGAVRHYKLIEMQLSLMYDAIYTKAGVIHKWYGFCIRIVSVLGTSTAFLLFHLHLTARTSRGNNKGGDVTISYILLVGALVLEAISLCKALVTFLRSHRRHTGRHGWEWLLHALTFVGRRVQPASSLLWQGSIGQYNLFHLCTRDSNKLGSRLAKKMKLEDWWNKLHFRSTLTPTVDFKEVVHHLMPLIADFRPSASGTSILRNRVAFDLDPWYFGRDFNDSILIWSIVTEKCIHVAKDKQESNAAVHTNKSWRGVPQQSQQMEDKRILQAVEVLSNYVMFLLVIKPELLPIYRLQKAHTDLCHVFDDIWSSHRHGNDACNSSAPSHKSWNPFNVLKEQFRSLIELFHQDSPNASRIEQRKELISYMFNPGCPQRDQFLDTPEGTYLPCNIIKNANDVWEAIFDRRELSETLEILLAVWGELLVYAGEHCSRDSHVRNLTDNGGEFITILWLMFQYDMSRMYVTSPKTDYPAGSDQEFSEDNIV